MNVHFEGAQATQQKEIRSIVKDGILALSRVCLVAASYFLCGCLSLPLRQRCNRQSLPWPLLTFTHFQIFFVQFVHFLFRCL